MSSRKYEEIKDRLSVVMLSQDQTQLYNNIVPHVPMGDMTMAYQIEWSDGDKRLVRYSDLSDYKVTASELHHDALENAERLHPAIVQTIEETLGLPPNRSATVPTMYVVTNETGEQGAAAIGYPGMMQRLAERIGGDFVILPSSVHEMLVVQTKGADLHKLSDLLQRVNREEVAPQDLLSNTLYCYDSKAMMVMRASVYEQLQQRDAVLMEKARAYGVDRASVLQDLKSRQPQRQPNRPDPGRANRIKRREESL